MKFVFAVVRLMQVEGLHVPLIRTDFLSGIDCFQLEVSATLLKTKCAIFRMETRAGF